MDTLFFIVSKVAWAVLDPLNLMVFMVLAGVLLMRRLPTAGKGLTTLGLGLLLLNMAYPVGDWLMAPLESRFERPHPMPDDIDGIILLGGGEELGRSLSWKQPQLGLGGDRYMEAVWLARLYREVPIYFSGGAGSVQMQGAGAEGSIARTLLRRLGIDGHRLVIESDSRNTWENFNNLKERLRPDGRYLLITSAYHMPRCVGIARKLGIRVIPWPTDYRSYAPAYRKVDFDLFDHLESLRPAVREWIGLTAYHLTGKTSEWLPAPAAVERLP